MVEAATAEVEAAASKAEAGDAEFLKAEVATQTDLPGTSSKTPHLKNGFMSLQTLTQGRGTSRQRNVL